MYGEGISHYGELIDLAIKFKLAWTWTLGAINEQVDWSSKKRALKLNESNETVLCRIV